MLSGCQVELAYIFQDWCDNCLVLVGPAFFFTKEKPIFRVLPRTQGPACFVGDVDVSPRWRLRSV